MYNRDLQVYNQVLQLLFDWLDEWHWHIFFFCLNCFSLQRDQIFFVALIPPKKHIKR